MGERRGQGKNNPRTRHLPFQTLTALDWSRLLLQNGTDVAAMALDAANSIEASNRLERMLAHQLAAAAKLAMEQMWCVSYALAFSSKSLPAAPPVLAQCPWTHTAETGRPRCY
jgi:hypothetical protein